MELELYRIDYTIVGVTSNKCMKLLPSSFKESQKIAVGDNDGILQVFSIKKEDIQIQFKTLPGAKIASLQLAGAKGSPADKIFIASENEVRGYTKKGKLFLSFDTNLTEPITSMYVLGNDLFVCGKHIYNHYKDCKDVGSYLCGDCIVDVVALHSEKTHRLISLIACEGRMIRAIEHARVTLSMEIQSAPTTLHILEQNNAKHVLFGTADGRVGLLDVEELQSFKRWIVTNGKYSSGVSSVETFDLTGDGIKNLVIGRNDGNLEIYSINITDEIDEPILIFLDNCNESITALQCGTFGNSNHEEVIIATYTGRVLGLSTEARETNLNPDKSSGNYNYPSDTSQKIIKLKNELDDLQTKLSKEREKYQTMTQSIFDEVSAIPALSIKHSMILSKSSAAYTLSLEVPTAIDNVLLQSNVPIDLLDVEKNSAVVSYSEQDPKSGNHLLATYRCQINTNRLEVKIRTIEGQHGILQAYITPLMQPKFCQLKIYEIKPLSLHLRIHNFDENRPHNILIVKGHFSLAEVHSWIYQCIPEVPEKPQVTEKTELCFQSSFLDTILFCSYCKNEAEFKSDNVSTISTIKDFLSKEATRKKIKIEVVTNIIDESINHVLKIIDPKLKRYKELSNKITLLNALSELEMNDTSSLNCLSPKNRELLEIEKQLRQEFSNRPSYLDRFYGIITDLYVDYHKLKGTNAKSKIPKLINTLDDYTYEDLLQQFRPDN